MYKTKCSFMNFIPYELKSAIIFRKKHESKSNRVNHILFDKILDYAYERFYR